MGAQNNTNLIGCRIFIETYGCQMNLNDTEIVNSILTESGAKIVNEIESADVILMNTCSVRENAEQRIFRRVENLRHLVDKKKIASIGILGCMAERLHEKLGADKIFSVVAGPDEYRKLPHLIEQSLNGNSGVAVKLSEAETYDDVAPLRSEGVNAWLSIMRGCNNFCSYCVVPYTRGRERSRSFESLLEEICSLQIRGFKEITLLGQNVNSYKDSVSGKGFPGLLAACAKAAPEVRFRFTTSHPRDMSEELIGTMAAYNNICKHIHLPAQSGSNEILKSMNRRYTVEHYLGRIEKIRAAMPGCSLTTDIIAGYPGETLENHRETIELLKKVRYDGAYMFRYSPRENTKAFEMKDDVPEEEKLRRLNEIINLQQKISAENNNNEIGNIHEILAEGESKRNKNEWMGRAGTNKTAIFSILEFPQIKAGSLVKVKIKNSTAATLFADVIEFL